MPTGSVVGGGRAQGKRVALEKVHSERTQRLRIGASSPVGRSLVVHKVVHKVVWHTLQLKRGDAVYFRGDVFHAGAAHETVEKSVALHVPFYTSGEASVFDKVGEELDLQDVGSKFPNFVACVGDGNFGKLGWCVKRGCVDLLMVRVWEQIALSENRIIDEWYEKNATSVIKPGSILEDECRIQVSKASIKGAGTKKRKEAFHEMAR